MSGLTNNPHDKALLIGFRAEKPEHVMTLGQSLHNAGLREGITKGRQEGQLILLRRLLSHRFGPIPEWVESQIKNASTPQLETWSTRILDADSLEAIFK